MSSFQFPIKNNSSLFPESDIPNEKFIQDQIDYRDRYKDIKLPINVLAGKWLYLEDMRLGVMTDEKFHISTYGEMVDAKKEYLIEMIDNKDIMPLIMDIQRLIETVVWANVDEGNYAVEARIRKEINNWSEVYFTLTKHLMSQKPESKNYENEFIALLDSHKLNW